jgi:hypothetical protein
MTAYVTTFLRDHSDPDCFPPSLFAFSGPKKAEALVEKEACSGDGTNDTRGLS